MLARLAVTTRSVKGEAKRREKLVTYEELHLGDFLVHLLHKLDDEVHELVLEHLLGVEISDQERDVIALNARS